MAGADKFFNLLTHWDKYLPAKIATKLPVSAATFMMIVGIIEIVAGLAVLTLFTRFGAYIVMIWLILIAINLIIAGYYDIAVRDLSDCHWSLLARQVAALHGDHWLPFTSRPESISTHAVVRWRQTIAIAPPA